MLKQVARSRGRASAGGRGRHGVPRRRGSVLVFVMALLGIMFVMGVAFIATMNFESTSIAIELDRGRGDNAADQVFEGLGTLLRGSMLAGSGEPVIGDLLGSFPQTFAEMPMVHNSASPIEPYVDWTDPDNPKLRCLWMTDLESLSAGEFDASGNHRRQIDTAVKNGYRLNPLEPSDPVLLDADGDGIVDSIEMEASVLGFGPSQLAGISNVVNGPERVSAAVRTGVRIVAHGGLVNLNEAHLTLIETVLDKGPQYRHKPQVAEADEQGKYSAMLEEPLIRRRGGAALPPRSMTPTELFGNPYEDAGDEPDGGGDMAHVLLPPRRTGEDTWEFETVYEDDHRYFPYAPDEPFYEDFADGPTMWAMRVEPETSFHWEADELDYDRMHLVTLVSHDDLLSRGGRYAEYNPATGQKFFEQDLRERMIEANRTNAPPVDLCDLRFEYADYPHDIPNGGECECPTDPRCEFDFRKGRLRLSLAWLEEALNGEVVEPTINEDQQIRLLQDVFTLMLYNARDYSNSYGSFELATDIGNNNFYWEPNYQAISLTAASLAANAIDFADADDVPTRIELRSSDLGDFDPDDPDSPLPEMLGDPLQPTRYVYGLERQPYITEVAVVTEEELPESDVAKPVGWAVELFNPYAGYDISDDAGYYLVFVDTTDPNGFSSGTFIALEKEMWSRDFTVFRTATDGASEPLPVEGAGVHILPSGATADLIADDKTVYLVRRVEYIEDEVPTYDYIVVDQFYLGGNFVQWQSFDLDVPTQLYSLERVAALGSGPADPQSWRAPVPLTSALPMDVDTLGADNQSTDPTIRPVEVIFANTGDLRSAFPTTGSMLMLMRHANRSIADYEDQDGDGEPDETNLAFTTRLVGSVTRYQGPPPGTPVVPDVELYTQIDNGRMPVFDTGMLYHLNPADQQFTELNEPGDLGTLPWGQLVFDYFTALSLSESGPYYRAPDSPEFTLDEADGPRVDMKGLRVHGRIDINAAPWMVLSGLPLMPADALPEVYREKVSKYAYAGQSVTDGIAGQIGERLAKAIVAYREVRAIAVQPPVDFEGTGDYGDPTKGRAWDSTGAIKWRRGSGFMSVGELANVCHPDAIVETANPPFPGAQDYSYYRTDSGMLDVVSDQQDYVAAIAKLVALGDWVAVRSHVYTVYGVLRGERDDSIEGDDPDETERLQVEDVDSRAVRFQETLDRLPTLLGERLPVRIGERTVGGYKDAAND